MIPARLICLAILTGATLAAALGSFGPRSTGIAVAVGAAAALGYWWVRAWAMDRERRRAVDKARHPVSQTYSIDEVFEMQRQLWDERPDPMELLERAALTEDERAWFGTLLHGEGTTDGL